MKKILIFLLTMSLLHSKTINSIEEYQQKEFYKCYQSMDGCSCCDVFFDDCRPLSTITFDIQCKEVNFTVYEIIYYPEYIEYLRFKENMILNFD